MKPSNSIILNKSKEFALNIIELYKYLCKEKKEFIISKQILRCGTSIGANTSEAYYAQSKRDFIARLSISLKEAGETKYWIELLYKSNFINKTKFDDYYDKINELIRILTSIIKTSKNNLTNY